MVETEIQVETCCNPELHTEHLCYIISQGMHLSELQAYTALIVEPKFRCDHCGRTANSNANLCVPVEL